MRTPRTTKLGAVTIRVTLTVSAVFVAHACFAPLRLELTATVAT